MTIRRAQLIAAAIAVLCCSQIQAEERVEKVGDWKMVINPVDNGLKNKDKKDAIDPTEYARIYKSIPFNRTEYSANPSYRHDATMEILFGKMRETTIVRHVNPQPRSRATQTPSYWHRYYYSSDYRYSPSRVFFMNTRGLY